MGIDEDRGGQPPRAAVTHIPQLRNLIYNVCAKMTIFKKRGFIDAAVEIVPIKEFADQMSTGVSYFEQFAWDLKERGVADIDVPVLILGIHSEEVEMR